MRAKPVAVAAREEKRERACRHGEIIGVALLETERARRVAAEMLEGESGEDRRGGDDEHDGARPQHHAAAAAPGSACRTHPSQKAYLAMRKPPTTTARKLVVTRVSRFSTKSRIGSPYMRNSSASRKKRAPRVMIDSSTNMKKS